MKKYLKGGIFIPLLLVIFASTLNAKFVIQNDSILPEKAVIKIEQMGDELSKKTKINLYLSALDKLKDNQKIIDYELEIIKSLKKPYILLAFSLNDSQVDIIASEDASKSFDKSEVLSVLPWRGSIIPILTSKAKNGKYESALLNGYADIADRVAKTHNIKLDSSIGSTNKNVIFFIKAIFYSIIFIAIGYMIYRRFKKGKNE